MRRRLLAVVLATTTLVVVAFAVPLGALVRSVARDRAISAAERDASALAPVLAITGDRDLIEAAIARTTLGADGRLTVVLPDGTPLGDDTPVAGDALVVARERQRSFQTSDSDGLSIYAPVLTGAGGVSVIRARVTDDLLDQGVFAAWGALALVALVLVVAAAFIADRLARSLTQEAAAMASTARALAGGDAGARVEPGTTPELVDAAHALNALADRIDALRASERERVADLSHRLRTPLTALRLDADRAGDASVVASVDRLEAEVSELIRAARRPLHASPVAARCDAIAVVQERARYWSALAEDDGRGFTIELADATEAAPVALEAPELGAAVDALIGNVFAHTPEGAPYRLEVTRAGSLVVVAVDDAGHGIRDRGAVLARGRSGASSTGLGLDIVRRAAEVAGGEVRITHSALGGARVEIRLPVLDAS